MSHDLQPKQFDPLEVLDDAERVFVRELVSTCGNVAEAYQAAYPESPGVDAQANGAMLRATHEVQRAYKFLLQADVITKQEAMALLSRRIRGGDLSGREEISAFGVMQRYHTDGQQMNVGVYVASGTPENALEALVLDVTPKGRSEDEEFEDDEEWQSFTPE